MGAREEEKGEEENDVDHVFFMVVRACPEVGFSLEAVDHNLFDL